MRWFDDLYLTEYMRENNDLRRKTIHRTKKRWKFFNDAYLLVLRGFTQSKNPVLEIIKASETAKKYYPAKNLLVIGLAEDYDSALELAGLIEGDTFKATGGFGVYDYIKGRRECS